MRQLTPLLLAFVVLAGPATVCGDDWPQWLGPQRDGVWRETGILKQFPKGGPKVLWRRDIGGGYAGPAVADGKVYVIDRVLDAGQKDPANPFQRTRSAGRERVFCLDASKGTVIWEKSYPCVYKMSYPAGPRATPLVAGGKVYTLGAMGHLHCWDAKKGDLVWQKDLLKDYSGEVPLWGFAAHPLLDGDNLIVLASKDPVVVALNKDTGKEVWKALKLGAAEIGYCPPTIGTFGGKRQLIIWHPEAVNGLDPATGKELWSYEWPIRANLSVSTPRQVGNQLFLTAFYNGTRLLEVGADSVKEVYRSKSRGERPNQTDMLHSIMPTPVIQGGHVYGVCSYGELRCLDLKTGKRLWSNLTATGTRGESVRWANAFLVPQGDRYFLFNEKGEVVIAKLTPKGYEEIDRAKILDPTAPLSGGRKVVWSHPAFANKAIFARNDKEIVAVSLAAEQ